MIHIFTVCTGSYKELWTNDRIHTLNNLLPGEQKTFNLISDNNELLNTFKNILIDDYCQFNYYHICNLVYPFITLLKYNYVYDMCNECKYDSMDFFIYLDSHSWCLEKPKFYWNKIIKDLEKYDICYTTNPYYLSKIMYDEIDDRSKHYVNKETFDEHKEHWSQMSFLMGNIYGLYHLNNAINSLLLQDIRYSDNLRKKQCILPNFMEQHYANYIFYDILVNNVKYNFNVHHDFYVSHNIFIRDESFIVCHYKVYDNKNIMNKRNSIIYNSDL